MPYDEDLERRVRDLVGERPDLSEKRMFGGLAFLIGGRMAVAASGQGGLLVRVHPAETDALVSTTRAHSFAMRGRPLQGWVRVDAEDVRTEADLAEWVERGVAYASSLPAKP